MQRALELATLGQGQASPNPLVGCVIVHHERIIGEGYHRAFGQAHAEVNAVASVADKSLLSQADFYITLEPCSYHGKTPACTDLLLHHRPQRVVVATTDPNPKVAGRGLAILQEAGITVEQGLLAAEAVALNKRFWINMTLQRPYVLLKWAQTADGFMARSDYSSKWISGVRARQWVHRWRTQEDAILVGYNTVVHDNPQLTARQWPGRNPVRVVFEPQGALSTDYKVFEPPGPVHVFTTTRQETQAHIHWHRVSEKNFVAEALAILYAQNIGSVLVEGGRHTLQQFIAAGMWDEARIFTATGSRFGQGIAAPQLSIPPAQAKTIGRDLLTISYNPKTQKIWQTPSL